MNILIVDDNKLNLELFCHMLSMLDTRGGPSDGRSGGSVGVVRTAHARSGAG
jgi:CheY-like chemotaxis protein